MAARRTVLFWAAMLAGTVALVEGLVRLLLDPPSRVPNSQEAPLLREDSALGYTFRPGAVGYFTAGGHRARIRIDGRGFRAARPDAPGTATTVLLAVGDSFTHGLGVDSTDPWPAQLEAVLRGAFEDDVAVLNAGVPGYSARQMRQTVERLLPDVRPWIVLFGLNPQTYWRVTDPYRFVAGHLLRSSAFADVTAGPGGLYYAPRARRPWLRTLDLRLNQRFELGAHVLALARRVHGWLGRAATGPSNTDAAPPAAVPVAEMLEAMLAEVQRARDTALAAGSRFVVVVINPQEPGGGFAPVEREYNRVVVEFCRRAAIEVVDVLPALTSAARGRPVFRSADDYHWTRAAHAVAAREVARQVTRLLPAPGDLAPRSGSFPPATR